MILYLFNFTYGHLIKSYRTTSVFSNLLYLETLPYVVHFHPPVITACGFPVITASEPPLYPLKPPASDNKEPKPQISYHLFCFGIY